MALLTYEQQHRSSLRHDEGRKCGDWSEVPEFYRPITEDEWESHVHVYQAPELDFSTPFDGDAPTNHLVFFLHMLNGKVYIINTEGYNYCRYAAEVKSPC